MRKEDAVIRAQETERTKEMDSIKVLQFYNPN